MAIYTTFFLCKPEELSGGFPAWRLPLAQPVRRQYQNPFSGKLSVIETREPEWPEDEVEQPEREYRAVAVEARYEHYLENRLPQFIRSCPHWAAKGLTTVELTPLLNAVGVEDAIEDSIYSPPSWGAFVQQLPQSFLVKLGSIDQNAVAERWAAAMSMPEHTHSVSGLRLSDGWIASEALEILKPIVAIAHQVKAGQRFYLLTEA